MEKTSFVEKSSCLPAGKGDNVPQAQLAVNSEALQGSESATKKHLVKSAGIMAGLTFLSRVLGMLRDVMSAKIFGTSWQWDSFLYAFSLPNFLRDLVGEGAISSAFIPVYSEILHKKGKPEAFQFGNITFTVMGTLLALFILCLEVIFNVILLLNIVPERLALTIDLLRYTFPYLWFISLYAIGMGILNSHRRFFSSSFAPILMNLAWIAGAIWVPAHFASTMIQQVRWLAMVLLFSGALQFFFEVPALFRQGFRFRWIWDLFSTDLKRAAHLILPSILGFAVVQVNTLVDMTLGFLIGPGANSSLWFGNRVMQFPLGIFAVAIATAVLPTVARQTALNDIQGVKKTLSFGLRSVFFIVLPSTVGLIVLREPIIRMLFERGAFDAVSSARTAMVLMCYSFGLFAYSGQKIVTSGFYAAQDTRSPVKAGVIALLLNIVFNLTLMQFLAESGLALATSLSGIIQFFVLMAWYHKKVAAWNIREISFSFGKILISSLCMGAVTAGTYVFLSAQIKGSGTFHELLLVSLSIGAGVVSYVGFCRLFRVHEMKEVIHGFFLKRLKPKTNSAV